jgi:hypothetical protein
MIAFAIFDRFHKLPAVIVSGSCCVATAAGVATAGVVTFENLPPTSESIRRGQNLSVPVDGFSFTSSGINPNISNAWRYYSPNPWLETYGTPAFAAGVRGTTALYSAYYDYISPNPQYWINRTDGSLWAFGQAYFTSVWTTGKIRLIGLRNGIEVFNFTQSISNTQQTMVSMSSDPGAINWIDTLKITNDMVDAAARGTFIMDDMQYTLPAPGVLALVGIAGHGIRRRRCRN